MNSLVIIGLVICFGLLLFVLSLRVPRSRYSDFELRRRQKAGDPQATFGLKRQAALATIVGLQQLISWILLTLMTALMLVLNPSWLGVFYTLILVILLGIISRLGFMHRLSQKFYRRIELLVIDFCLHRQKILKLLLPSVELSSDHPTIESRQELRHILENAKQVVSNEEATLLLKSIDFYEQTVGQIMTPREDMMTVGAAELLGPLVLSDLHKTGHTIFPVENNGEIVGMLDISDHAALRSKESVHVRDVMSSDVIRIDQAETLDETLKLLIAVKQSCLIVVEDDAVVGLISLGDVVRSLTGWKRR